MASDGGQTSTDSFNPSPTISANGRYVAFESDAGNLVQHDTNPGEDVFLHDTRTGRTTQVLLLTSGGQLEGHSEGPVISADGCCVAFEWFPPSRHVRRSTVVVRLVR